MTRTGGRFASKRSVIAAVVITFTLMSAVANVSPGSAQTSGAASSLDQMLAHVPDNAISRTVIWYGSLIDLQSIVLSARLNNPTDITKLPRQKQVAYLLDVNPTAKQVYYSPFSGLDNYSAWKKTFGIDSYAIERELTVGVAPNWYDVLVGKFDPNAISGALQKLGYKASQANGAALYSLNPDNASADLANGLYSALVVSDSQIIAAPSDSAISAATGGGKALGDDPAYKALLGGLENPSATPGASDTKLLSAVLFDGTYLSQNVITSDPVTASVGKQLSGDQIAALKARMAVLKPLPAYRAVGIGYRRDADPKNRFCVIALIYEDAGQAATARDNLTANLKAYASFQQDGRALFAGSDWKITPALAASADGSLQIVTVTLQLPQQTDVSWTQLVQSRDIGFLATQS